MIKPYTARQLASAALILALVLTSFISLLDDRVFADNRGRLSEFETVVSEDNGRRLIRGAFPGKPPATKMPAVNVPQPPAEPSRAAAAPSSSIAMSSVTATTSTSPYVYTAGTSTVLTNVPAFYWSYGCSPTAAAMLFGYYDRTGYSNMYTGPTNDGVCPLPVDHSTWGTTQYSILVGECPLSASHQNKDGRTGRGHVDDYWIDYSNTGPDPYYNNWTEHTPDCTADFMGTSQSKYIYNGAGLPDGFTLFYYYDDGTILYDYTGCEPDHRDGCHGMRLFAEWRGYTVKKNYTQWIKGQASDPNKGFTYEQFQSEINAGRPVIIQIQGHSMLGYGYDTSNSSIYVHDTWDYQNHSMIWGGKYSDRQHYAVTVIELEPVLPVAPTLTSPANGSNVGGTSITFTWGASSGATQYYISVTTTTGTPFYSGVITATSVTIPGFPNNGTQYRWSVAAGNSAGWSAGAPTITFTNAP